MWKVTNTANDRSKVDLHRTASKFITEPSIAGVRLRLGQSILIEDNQYERLKTTLEGWVAKGMVELCQVGADGKPVEAKADSEEQRRVTAPLPESEPVPAPVMAEAAVVPPPPPVWEPETVVANDWEPGAVASDTVAEEAPVEAPKAEGHSKKGPGKKKLY